MDQGPDRTVAKLQREIDKLKGAGKRKQYPAKKDKSPRSGQTIHAGKYSPKDYSALNAEERAEVAALRAKSSRSAGATGTGEDSGEDDRPHKVGRMESSEEAEAQPHLADVLTKTSSKVTIQVDDDDDSTDAKAAEQAAKLAKGAGNQFGRSAHTNKSDKKESKSDSAKKAKKTAKAKKAGKQPGTLKG